MALIRIKPSGLFIFIFFLNCPHRNAKTESLWFSPWQDISKNRCSIQTNDESESELCSDISADKSEHARMLIIIVNLLTSVFLKIFGWTTRVKIVGLDLTTSHQAPSVTGGCSSNMVQP